MANKIYSKIESEDFQSVSFVEPDEIKSIEVKSLEVEDNAIMIMVGDWVRRVYFDLSWKDKEKWLEQKSHYKGRNFTINYVGDFNDAHTVKLLPIKSI